MSCNITCWEHPFDHFASRRNPGACIDTSAMPLNTRSSQSTQPTRTQRKKHGRRGAQDSEDDADDAPANTQTLGEDDDLDQTRGVNNEVGRTTFLLPSR